MSDISDDLTQRVIDRMARIVRFKLEIQVMSDDYAKGVGPTTLNNQIWKLSRDYNISPWLIRGLVEQHWKDTP